MRTMSLTWYLICSAVLILAGALFTFEGGAVLITVGLTLVLLAPLRGHRTLYWPSLSAIVLFLAAFVLTVPLSCSGPIGPSPGEGVPWTCRSIIGITQTGRSASWTPSIAIGVLVEAGGFFLIRLATRPRETKASPPASIHV